MAPFRATGLQPGEVVLAEAPTAAAVAAVTAPVAVTDLDETLVAQLSSMGFDLEACKRTAFNVRNGDFEAAVNYLMTHLDDPGLIYSSCAIAIHSNTNAFLY